MKSHILKNSIEKYEDPYYPTEYGVIYDEYAYRVYYNHKLATLTEIEEVEEIGIHRDLKLGEHLVFGWDMFEFQETIPKFYCVREKNGDFVCGLDLMDNGKVWESSTRSEFDTIEEAMKSIAKKESLNPGNINIHVEGKMKIN
jgi:hypothetical protein